jgi:hypothetical protein
LPLGGRFIYSNAADLDDAIAGLRIEAGRFGGRRQPTSYRLATPAVAHRDSFRGDVDNGPAL